MGTRAVLVNISSVWQSIQVVVFSARFSKCNLVIVHRTLDELKRTLYLSERNLSKNFQKIYSTSLLLILSVLLIIKSFSALTVFSTHCILLKFVRVLNHSIYPCVSTYISSKIMHWSKISINLMGNRALLAHEVLLSHILIINSFTTRGMFHKYAFYTIAVFLKGFRRLQWNIFTYLVWFF